jgi:hypothetical protein
MFVRIELFLFTSLPRIGTSQSVYVVRLPSGDIGTIVIRQPLVRNR